MVKNFTVKFCKYAIGNIVCIFDFGIRFTFQKGGEHLVYLSKVMQLKTEDSNSASVYLSIKSLHCTLQPLYLIYV